MNIPSLAPICSEGSSPRASAHGSNLFDVTASSVLPRVLRSAIDLFDIGSVVVFPRLLQDDAVCFLESYLVISKRHACSQKVKAR